MRSTGFPDVFLLHIGTSWNMVEKPVSTRFQRGFGKRKERRKELHEEVLFESSKKLILMQVRKKGAPRGNYHFECDLFDLLSNAPYEIVRHRPRASSGRMRDFGARTAIFRRGARPRKARRCGIHCGQTGQWVTPFRVLFPECRLCSPRIKTGRFVPPILTTPRGVPAHPPAKSRGYK